MIWRFYIGLASIHGTCSMKTSELGHGVNGASGAHRSAQADGDHCQSFENITWRACGLCIQGTIVHRIINPTRVSVTYFDQIIHDKGTRQLHSRPRSKKNWLFMSHVSCSGNFDPIRIPYMSALAEYTQAPRNDVTLTRNA